MATRTISTKLAIEGENEYRQSVANINNSLKTLKSELALVESEFQGAANSTAALTAKGEVLSKTQLEQKSKIEETRKALENAQKAQEAYAQCAADYGAKIAHAEKRLEGLTGSSKKTKAAQAELNAELEEYRAAQAKAQSGQEAAQKGVEEWQRKLNYANRDLNVLNGKIDENAKYLEEAKNSANGTATSIDEYGKKTNKAARELERTNQAMNTLATTLAASGITKAVKEIVQGITACVAASVELESAMAGVYKTVEGTPEQLTAISDGIKQMATEIPATTAEIAAVAEAAGQLGIAADDVLGFSRVMLDLGESTNLSAEEAATALARFANITGTSAGDYERLGSTIVGLGNNFATTEKEITDMATRLASAGTLAGLSEPEIMALATAMSSVGIEAEAGGTAMTQTLTEIEKAVSVGGASLDEFARIAGMSSGEFSNAWETDAVGALQAFIAGLGRLDEQGESATLVLDDLGLSGVRQSNMLKSMALASDTLTGAVSMANRAWEENTALSEEAEKRYATTESKLAMMNNAFTNVKAAIGDTLAPALKEIAEAGTNAFTWAAEFIEKNPWLVQAMTGVLAGVIALTVGVTAYTVVAQFGSVVTTAFSKALHACPVVFVASAIIALVTAVGAFAASASEATNKTKELTGGIEENRKAHEKAVEGIEKETGSTLDMVAALETATAQEHKTAAEKAAILDLVDQLNEAVPGLSLAYDEQTDSLNMTAEALRGVVEAEAQRQLQGEAVDRMVQNKKEEIAISQQLEEASGRLSQAENELAEAQAQAAEGTWVGTYALTSMQAAVDFAKADVKKLTTAQEENEAEAESLNGQYDDLSGAIEENTRTVEENGGAAETQTQTLEELAKAADALTKTTEEVTSAQDTLTSALKEQGEEGSLGLDTTLKLIDAGYASALSIDTETGAITVNKDTYIALAKAKLEEQAAAIESQSASVQAAILMKEEAYAAQYDAVGHLELAKARKMAAAMERDEDLQALYDQQAAFDAQTAAIKRTMDSLGSYTGAVATASRSSSRASEKIKTQAEKDLETYKELKATLDHERAMSDKEDEEADAEYYARLKELRDQYLTDDTNLSEYRKVSEQLHKYDKELVDKKGKLYEQELADFKKLKEDLDYERAVGEIEDGEYWKRLALLRDEYLTDDGNLDTYRDINEQIYKYDQALLDKQLDAYQDQLEAIADEADAAMKEIQSAIDGVTAQQDAMAKKLSGYGELFTIEDDKLALESLQDQIEAVKRYGETLDQLRERGISDSLMDEILGMDIEEATAYGEKLLDMGDEQWETYNEKWEEKQQRAREVAEAFYKDELDTLKTEYNDRLDEALNVLKGTAFDAGQDATQGLMDGMASREQELYNKASAIAEEISRRLSEAWGAEGEEVDGSHAGGLAYVPFDGYVAELHQGERVLTAEEAKEYIARSMPSRYDLPAPADNHETQTAAVVNGLVGAMAQMAPAASGGGPYEINLNVGGKKMASVLFDPLKEELKRRGERL